MTDTCQINRDDVARETSLERQSIAQSAQAERLGLENLNATGLEGTEGRDTTEQFGFQNLNATRSEGTEGRSETERFGFQNLGATQHASDLNVTASQAAQDAAQSYGYRNVVATKDAEKDILAAICGSTSGLSASAREILLQVASGTKEVLLSSAGNTKDLLLQACGDTASIKSQSASEFKDVLLQNAQNAAAVAVQNTLNAKDAEISAVTKAKDAALTAAVNFERLFGQADRNTAALQASIAECCCEQKSLVIERTGHTDALIRALDEGRVKEELRFAREELTALRLRASLTPAPVAAVAL